MSAWNFGAAGLGGLINFFSTIFGNRKNEQLTRETNANNLQMQREANETNMRIAEQANALQREESEKAYRRSMPINQVANMQAAGMSKAAALNTINGGGSYQPAAVNVAQVQASRDESPTYSTPQLDVGAVVSALQVDQQLKQSDKQLDEQKRQFNETLKFEREKWKEDLIDKKHDRLIKTLQAQVLHSDAAIRNLEYLRTQFTNEEAIDAEKAELIARKSQSLLDDLRSKKVLDAMSSMSEEELSDLFELQATLNMLQQGLQYDSTGAIIKGAKKLVSLLAGAKGVGKNIRMN